MILFLIKIYRATVGLHPTIIYTPETRAKTLKTRQMLAANYMKVLRQIVGKIKIDRI